MGFSGGRIRSSVDACTSARLREVSTTDCEARANWNVSKPSMPNKVLFHETHSENHQHRVDGRKCVCWNGDKTSTTHAVPTSVKTCQSFARTSIVHSHKPGRSCGTAGKWRAAHLPGPRPQSQNDPDHWIPTALPVRYQRSPATQYKQQKVVSSIPAARDHDCSYDSQCNKPGDIVNQPPVYFFLVQRYGTHDHTAASNTFTQALLQLIEI